MPPTVYPQGPTLYRSEKCFHDFSLIRAALPGGASAEMVSYFRADPYTNILGSNG